jgi:hypothetical protein
MPHWLASLVPNWRSSPGVAVSWNRVDGLKEISALLKENIDTHLGFL